MSKIQLIAKNNFQMKDYHKIKRTNKSSFFLALLANMSIQPTFTTTTTATPKFEELIRFPNVTEVQLPSLAQKNAVYANRL